MAETLQEMKEWRVETALELIQEYLEQIEEEKDIDEKLEALWALSCELRDYAVGTSDGSVA